MSNPDFIGVYDNALSSEECEELISFFESSTKRKGVIYSSDKKQLITDDSIKSNVELSNALVSTTPKCVTGSLRKCINKYIEEYPSMKNIASWGLRDDYTFQKFQYYGDGYKQWHTEHNNGESSNRILAWMFYLNNASGTEFLHFPTVDAVKGRCIIWPSAFTHLHKSAPNKGLKYIMSGWISYI